MAYKKTKRNRLENKDFVIERHSLQDKYGHDKFWADFEYCNISESKYVELIGKLQKAVDKDIFPKNYLEKRYCWNPKSSKKSYQSYKKLRKTPFFFNKCDTLDTDTAKRLLSGYTFQSFVSSLTEKNWLEVVAGKQCKMHEMVTVTISKDTEEDA